MLLQLVVTQEKAEEMINAKWATYIASMPDGKVVIEALEATMVCDNCGRTIQVNYETHKAKGSGWRPTCSGCRRGSMRYE